jgi:hypothetical protein
MAFRIAELMQESESGPVERRKAAKSECTELVFRLWDHRAKMFPGRPLGEVIEAFEALTENPRVAPRRPRSGPASWQSTLGELRDIQRQEVEIWRSAALAGLSPSAAKKWLAQQAVPLSAEEKRLSQILEPYLSEFSPPRTPAETPSKQSRHSFDRLRELQKQRDALLTRLAKGLSGIGPAQSAP